MILINLLIRIPFGKLKDFLTISQGEICKDRKKKNYVSRQQNEKNFPLGR